MSIFSTLNLKSLALGLVTIASIVHVQPTNADVLYGTGYYGAGGVSTPTLFTINTTTGVATPVGPTIADIGSPDYGGLTYDPTRNTLFGSGPGPGGAWLFSVNRTTGAATAIGEMGVLDLTGLAFDTANNTLYGLGCTANCPYPDPFPNSLYSINPSTGAATELFSNVGQFGVVAGLEYVASSNLLYAFNYSGGDTDLYTINPATGTTTFVGMTADQTGGGGLAYDATAGLMYTDGNSNTQFPEGLWSLSLSTGAATFIGFNGPNVILRLGGLSFAPAVDGQVPAPGALTLTLSGLLGLIAWRIRRRRLS